MSQNQKNFIGIYLYIAFFTCCLIVLLFEEVDGFLLQHNVLLLFLSFPPYSYIPYSPMFLFCSPSTNKFLEVFFSFCFALQVTFSEFFFHHLLMKKRQLTIVCPPINQRPVIESRIGEGCAAKEWTVQQHKKTGRQIM